MTDWLCFTDRVAMMLILREADMAGAIYVSGRFLKQEEATISVLDHGLLYGDGVFEGIRAYNGRVFKLDRHVERLFKSARAVRLDPPFTPEALEEIVLETCRRN